MSVQYKFKAQKDYHTVEFQGVAIKVLDLKRAIFGALPKYTLCSLGLLRCGRGRCVCGGRFWLQAVVS